MVSDSSVIGAAGMALIVAGYAAGAGASAGPCSAIFAGRVIARQRRGGNQATGGSRLSLIHI